MKTILATLVLLLSTVASAVDVVTIDNTISIEDNLANNCPWISNTESVAVVSPTDIGWAGGAGGKIIGKLMNQTGAGKGNNATLAGNIGNAKAVLLNTQYFNNDKQAQIFVEELMLTSRNGDRTSVNLGNEQKVLTQSKNDALLICFTNQDDFVRLSVNVSHRNVDGSRPKMGITALNKKADQVQPPR